MTGRRIDLRVAELAIEGLSVTDAELLAASFERELRSLATAPDPSAAGGPHQTADPRELGAEAAREVWRRVP